MQLTDSFYICIHKGLHGLPVLAYDIVALKVNKILTSQSQFVPTASRDMITKAHTDLGRSAKQLLDIITLYRGKKPS